MADPGRQGGTAHSKAEAQERARASIRLASGPADDLIAGTMASAGLRHWAITAVCTAVTFPSPLVLALPTALLTRLLAFSACAVVGSVVFAAVAAGIRRPVYLTVTRDQLICYRVPKASRQPAAAQVLFRASLRAVCVSGNKYEEGRNRTIHFASRGPAAKDCPQQHGSRAWLEERRLRRAFQQPFTVDRSWYRELGEVMTALQAAGAEVHPALLDITLMP